MICIWFVDSSVRAGFEYDWENFKGCRKNRLRKRSRIIIIRDTILIYLFFFTSATANRTEDKGSQHIGATRTSLGIQTSDFFCREQYF